MTARSAPASVSAKKAFREELISAPVGLCGKPRRSGEEDVKALNPSTSKIKRFSHFAYLRDRVDQVYANRRNEKTALQGGFFEGSTGLQTLEPGNGSKAGSSYPKTSPV